MVVWDDSLSVGFEILDDDHKFLVGMINNLESMIGTDVQFSDISLAVDALNDYADQHFRREEALMLLAGYSARVRHGGDHKKFTSLIATLIQVMSVDPKLINLQGLVDYLVTWLINHIQISDRAYIPQLEKNRAIVDTASAALREGMMSMLDL